MNAGERWHARRLQRWLPFSHGWSSVASTVLFLFIGTMFMGGLTLLFGLKGDDFELHEFPFPQQRAIAWVCFYVAVECALPWVLRRRVNRGERWVGQRIASIVRFVWGRMRSKG